MEVDLRRLVTVYDVGKSIKPTMTEGQIHGGAGMAIGVPDVEAHIYECPSPEGRMGPKVSAR